MVADQIGCCGSVGWNDRERGGLVGMGREVDIPPSSPTASAGGMVQARLLRGQFDRRVAVRATLDRDSDRCAT